MQLVCKWEIILSYICSPRLDFVKRRTVSTCFRSTSSKEKGWMDGWMDEWMDSLYFICSPIAEEILDYQIDSIAFSFQSMIFWRFLRWWHCDFQAHDLSVIIEKCNQNTDPFCGKEMRYIVFHNWLPSQDWAFIFKIVKREDLLRFDIWPLLLFQSYTLLSQLSKTLPRMCFGMAWKVD
jgi:hypothetical protein